MARVKKLPKEVEDVWEKNPLVKSKKKEDESMGMDIYEAFAVRSTANIWKPEQEGEHLEGVFLGYVQLKYGQAMKILGVDGEMYLVPISKGLEVQVNNVPLNTGQVVGIKYNGKGISKNNMEFKDFIFAVIPDDHEFAKNLRKKLEPILEKYGL